MKSTTITYIFLAFIGILGYNAFLIKRDAEMFKAYYPKTCQQDCNQETGK